MIKKLFTIIILLVINTVLCTGCGFHPRSSANLPPALDTITLRSPNIDSALQAGVVRLLKSLHVRLEKNAPVVLYINGFSFTHNQPGFTTTTQAVTYTYRMTITFSILKNGRLIVPEKTLSAFRNVIMNVNQVYTSSTASLARNELEREIINLLYIQLISQNTHKAFQHVR